MQSVQTPIIPVVGEWIAQHPGTISLGQGIVHYSPPQLVHDATIQAISDDNRVDRYGLVRGLSEFLEAVAKKVEVDNGFRITEHNRVICTSGSNMGFLNAVLAIGDVGDEIILLSPYYFNHEMAIDLAGCRPINVPTTQEYQIDLNKLREAIGPRTRAIVTVSPNNPTGAVYPASDLKAVNELCRSNNIYHIHDEAYEYFIYGDEKHLSVASIPDSTEHTISLFTLSKAYGMAGWRCGYMVVPSHLETDIKKIQDTNLVCPPIISQIAATAALNVGSEWCRERIRNFSAVRNLVIEELSSLGDACYIPRPDGAFYALLQLDCTVEDLKIVETLIRDYGVAVMPGTAFGVLQGCWIRIAYGALDQATVAEGIGRLKRGLTHLLTSN